eukprot:2109114-Amphidinium_carterae.1
MPYTTTGINQKNKAHRHEIPTRTTTTKRRRAQIHKVSTENNPANLMMKYQETAKIKKHNETVRITPLSWQPQL